MERHVSLWVGPDRVSGSLSAVIPRADLCTIKNFNFEQRCHVFFIGYCRNRTFCTLELDRNWFCFLRQKFELSIRRFPFAHANIFARRCTWWKLQCAHPCTWENFIFTKALNTFRIFQKHQPSAIWYKQIRIDVFTFFNMYRLQWRIHPSFLKQKNAHIKIQSSTHCRIQWLK